MVTIAERRAKVLPQSLLEPGGRLSRRSGDTNQTRINSSLEKLAQGMCQGPGLTGAWSAGQQAQGLVLNRFDRDPLGFRESRIADGGRSGVGWRLFLQISKTRAQLLREGFLGFPVFEEVEALTLQYERSENAAIAYRR
jgi:hypothetical protein